MEDIKNIVKMIDEVLEDPSVPRNIKRALNEAKARLLGKDEIKVKVRAALYQIEAISEDVNMPMHTRTQIWSIIGALEAVKE